MWAAGVILLSLITGRYPFFLSKDDNYGLWEFHLIFGPGKLQEAAALCGTFYALLRTCMCAYSCVRFHRPAHLFGRAASAFSY